MRKPLTHHTHPGRSGSWLLLLLALATTGCARSGRQEPTRHPVSGTVTLDGTPLQDGKVHFVTVSKGLIEAVPIKEGKFSGMAAGGDRRVEFYVIKDVPLAESGYKVMPGETPPATVRVQMLPPHLNTSGTFTATVTSSGPNQFTFDLSTKEPSTGKSP